METCQALSVQRENGGRGASVPDDCLARLGADQIKSESAAEPVSRQFLASPGYAMTRRRELESVVEPQALQRACAANFLAGAADERSESVRA